MITDGPYYSRLVESVFTGLVGLDTTGYRWVDYDRWSQARAAPDPESTPEHLTAWLSLGTVASFTRSHIEHTTSFEFAARHQHDDDALSQGRAHAAARDAAEFLNRWSMTGGERIVPKGWALTRIADFSVVAITCSLIIPRGT